MTWAPIDLSDNAQTRREGNAIDDGTEPPRPPVDAAKFDHGPAVWRVLSASSGTPRTP
jgi:hypothetical protein